MPKSERNPKRRKSERSLPDDVVPRDVIYKLKGRDTGNGWDTEGRIADSRLREEAKELNLIFGSIFRKP
jgi:hypothetical protein